MNKYKKLVERWESPLFVSLIIAGFNKQFSSSLNLDCNIEQYKFEAGAHFISSADLSKIKRALENAAKQQVPFWKSYKAKCKAAGDELLATANLLADKAGAFKNSKSFQEGFDNFAEATKRMTPYLISTVLLEEVFEAQLQEVLSQQPCIQRDPEMAAIVVAELRACAAPNEPIQEMRSCATFAREIDIDPKIKNAIFQKDPEEFLYWLELEACSLHRKIQQHVERFEWITTHGYRHRPMEKVDLVRRIIALLKRESIPSIPGRRERRPLSIILGEEPLPQLEVMANTLADLIALRFFRINIHLKAFTKARPFFSALANISGIREEQIVFCTESEIQTALACGKLPPSDELASREENGFSIELNDGQLVTRTLPKLSIQRSKSVPVILTGETGNLGTANGASRIVHSAPDCNSLKFGEILVTGMTTPDFVSALEKCGAIVTDEGGILCHAAVVSRELNVPCVIGTGDATERLSDGQYIDIIALSQGGVVTTRDMPEYLLGQRFMREFEIRPDERVYLGRLVADVRNRIRADYAEVGKYAGEFGLPHRNSSEGKLHQSDTQGQELGITIDKPEYFLTYWGWRVSPRLLPEKCNAWGKLTIRSIARRFGENDWIQEEKEIGPTHEPVKFSSLRYTVRAGQILLLAIRAISPDDYDSFNTARDIINRLARHLIKSCNKPEGSKENPFIDDGWRRNLDGPRTPSLYTSAYALGFLQRLREDSNSDLIIDHSKFKQESEKIAQRLAKYLCSNFKNYKWEYNEILWWPEKASLIFTEILDAPNPLNCHQAILSSLESILTPEGHIQPADDGKKQGCSNLSMAIRVARALMFDRSLSDNQSLAKLVRKILWGSFDWPKMKTHDLAFIYSIAESIVLDRSLECSVATPKDISRTIDGIRESNKVFISYCHDDRKYLRELKKHLAPYKELEISIWSDEDVRPGQEFKSEINAAIASSSVGVLLVTNSFLASDFIINEEVPRLMEANDRGEVTLCWIPVDHAAYDTQPFSKIQALIDPKTPLRTMRPANRNEKWVKIALDIAEAAGLRKKPIGSKS